MQDSQLVKAHMGKVTISDKYLIDTPFTINDLYTIANYKKDPTRPQHRTLTRKRRRSNIAKVIISSSSMSYEDHLHKAGLKVKKPITISDFYR